MRSGPRRRASGSRRRRGGGQGAPGCRRSRRRTAARGGSRATPARRARSVRRGRRPAARWPATLVRRPRSSTSARVRPAVERSSHPSVVADVRPATRSSALGSCVTARTAARRSRTRDVSTALAASPAAPDPAAPPMRTRSSGPSMSMPSRHRPSEVVHRVAGHLGKPARERVVGRKVRQVSQHFRGLADRDGVRGVPVVGQRDAVVGRRGVHQVTDVAPRRERDRAGPEEHEPARPVGGDDRPDTGAERQPVGWAGHDRRRHRRRPRRTARHGDAQAGRARRPPTPPAGRPWVRAPGA